MPTNYKTRAAMMKSMRSKGRSRSTVNSRVARAVINMTGGANRRRLVSVPAALRARGGLGGMATEIKSVDYVGALTEASGTALKLYSPASGVTAAVLLQMPIEGSSFYNRIARRTRGVSLEIKGHIAPTLSNAAARGLQWGRILIIYDRQPNGAVPSVATILTDYDEGGNAATYSTSGINMDNRDRFLVLRDRKFLLPPIGINGVAPTTTSANLAGTNADMAESRFLFHEFIKLNGLETQYKASTTGAIGDIASGSYIILCMSETDTSVAAYQFTYQCRYKFFD